GRHINITDAIKDYVNSTVEVLKKYNIDIIYVTCTISADGKQGKKACSFEFTLNTANIATVVVKQKDTD
ncbi:HPF/RaiA family ribosome-associated protein, partial [Aliarcobacter butzleri]